jgi:hypothetical protein
MNSEPIDKPEPNQADEDAAEQARKSRRDSTLLRTSVRSLDGHAPIQVIVRNLSEGGMMAENAKLFPMGTRVEVELRSLGWVAGSVAWTVENRMGIAFALPIDPVEARKPVPQTNPDLIVKRPPTPKRMLG